MKTRLHPSLSITALMYGVAPPLLIQSVSKKAFIQIQDKKWEERRPWHRKPSPSSTASTTTSSQLQHQGDSADLASIHAASASTLLLGSQGDHGLQPLQSSVARGYFPSTVQMNGAASIILPPPPPQQQQSGPVTSYHYESAPHLHATLGLRRLHQPMPENNQGSTWKRLLSTLLRSDGSSYRRPPSAASRRTLNAENTLRLQAHRQLFQYPYAAASGPNGHLGPPTATLDRSNEASLQYYASVSFCRDAMPASALTYVRI